MKNILNKKFEFSKEKEKIVARFIWNNYPSDLVPKDFNNPTYKIDKGKYVLCFCSSGNDEVSIWIEIDKKEITIRGQGRPPSDKHEYVNGKWDSIIDNEIKLMKFALDNKTTKRDNDISKYNKDREEAIKLFNELV